MPSKPPVKGKSYYEIVEINPCEGCPAPCCKMLLTPQQLPQTIRDIDHMRYSILFENSEIALSSGGDWSLIKWQNCTLLEQKKCTCSVHGTSKQPLICKDFSPHQCWYKRNFVKGESQSDIYRLNRQRFEIWIEEIAFDELGVITSFPDFEQIRKKLDNIPIEPVFEMNSQYVKSTQVIGE